MFSLAHCLLSWSSLSLRSPYMGKLMVSLLFRLVYFFLWLLLFLDTFCTIFLYVLGEIISYNIACVPSEDSDQHTTHPRNGLDFWLPQRSGSLASHRWSFNDFNQIARLRMLICVFTDRIFNLVGYAVPRIKCNFITLYQNRFVYDNVTDISHGRQSFYTAMAVCLSV